MKQEFMNVELLISMGADLNAQDFIGQTPLHIAIIRIGQVEDSYQEYKKIIKELLFHGADRTIETKNGESPSDFVDYIEEFVDEQDYLQLKSMLQVSRPCLCFLRRRPLAKIEKDPTILIIALVFNLCLALIYLVWMYEPHWVHAFNIKIFEEKVHQICVIASTILLVVGLFCFVLTSLMDPGYLKPSPKHNYEDLVE